MAHNAGGGSPPSTAFAAGLLICCVVTSAVTAMGAHLYLHAAFAGASETPSPRRTPPKRASTWTFKGRFKAVAGGTANNMGGKQQVVDLQTLAEELVPSALRLDAYFSRERLLEFDHARLFDGCTNVLAVLDAIHPYLKKFFGDNAWLSASAENAQITTLQSSTRQDSDGRCVRDEDSDSEDSDDRARRLSLRSRSSSFPRIRSRWRLPEWLDPEEGAEIMIYPGVDSHTFAPQKIINLDTGRSRDKRASSTSSESPRSVRRPPFGWSRSSVSQGEEEEIPKRRLIILPGAHVLGGTFDLSEGSIHIGKRVRIEPNVFIKGPAIIGARSTLRSGTYIRGDVIVGRNVVLRGELKNSVIMDEAELCHPGYCGDSICGFKSHFGNQVTTANLGLFATTSTANLMVEVEDVTYDTGRKKMGVILGDWSQLGCSTVTDPCTLIQQHTIVYPLTRLGKGIYGPSVLIKNKPMEKGVLEIVDLRPS